VTECSRCHGEVIDDQRRFIAPERHVDGVVDVIALTCTTCHGSGELGAPPPDLDGDTAVSALGVGAHQVHLSGGNNSRPVACNECHVVPAEVADPEHIDGMLPAEVTFEGVATADGRMPVWDRAAESCTESWCHGPTSADGSLSPAWTSEDGALGCTGCHGFPPALPHPRTDRCNVCHGAVVDADQTIVQPDLHVDGMVQVALPTDCNGCHGTDPSGAPPPDVDGDVDTTDPGVGAHLAHLFTTMARPVECGECHQVPENVLSDGHADTLLPAELSFSGVATRFGATPVYSGGTCTDTYCHGDSKPYGGALTQPVWTQVDGAQIQCWSCHGVPPPPPHPDRLRCFTCHGNIVTPAFEIISPMLHINGEIDF
jgi:predicted CxxxxCH...CXXCH cytochrome family protein